MGGFARGIAALTPAKRRGQNDTGQQRSCLRMSHAFWSCLCKAENLAAEPLRVQLSGLSEYQVRTKGIFAPVRRRTFALNITHQRLKSETSDFRLRHLNRGQRRNHELSQADKFTNQIQEKRGAARSFFFFFFFF